MASIDSMLLANVDDKSGTTPTVEAIADQFEKMMVAVFILAQKEDPSRVNLNVVDDRDMQDNATGFAYRVRLMCVVEPIIEKPADGGPLH